MAPGAGWRTSIGSALSRFSRSSSCTSSSGGRTSSKRPGAFYRTRTRNVIVPYLKVALTALLLHLCGSPASRLPGWIRGALVSIANRSLALYLLHIAVLGPILSLASSASGPVVSLGGWLGLVLAAFVAMLAMGIAPITGVQRMAGKHAGLLFGA